MDVQGRPGLPELRRRNLPSIIYFQNLENYKQSGMGVHFWKPKGITSDISAKKHFSLGATWLHQQKLVSASGAPGALDAWGAGDANHGSEGRVVRIFRPGSKHTRPDAPGATHQNKMHLGATRNELTAPECDKYHPAPEHLHSTFS